MSEPGTQEVVKNNVDHAHGHLFCYPGGLTLLRPWTHLPASSVPGRGRAGS